MLVNSYDKIFYSTDRNSESMIREFYFTKLQ